MPLSGLSAPPLIAPVAPGAAAFSEAENGMESAAELKARDAELEREWQWLVEALNTVARARAENGDAHAFRLMQAQCMAVGQRRVELSLQLAQLERRGANS